MFLFSVIFLSLTILFGCGDAGITTKVINQPWTSEDVELDLDSIPQHMVATRGLWLSDGFLWKRYVVNPPKHWTDPSPVDSLGILKFSLDGTFIDFFELHDNTTTHYKQNIQGFYGVCGDVCIIQLSTRNHFDVNVNIVRWDMSTGEYKAIRNHIKGGFMKPVDELFVADNILYVKYHVYPLERHIENNPHHTVEYITNHWKEMFPYEKDVYYAYDFINKVWLPEQSLTIVE